MNKPTSPMQLTTAEGHIIAYHTTQKKQADNQLGIVFMGGFMSDMTGTKAIALEEYCASRSYSFTRFDYFGHGQSSGAFTDGTIGRWKEDVLAVLDSLQTPQILVGSSLGGWLMLLAAMARPEQVKGLIGIAAAPDFTETLMWDLFDEGVKQQLLTEGIYHLPTDYCNEPEEESYPITLQLIEEARQHLVMSGAIPVHCPVRLIHGLLDKDVPSDTALQLCEHLATDDVEITYIKDGGHRMSEPKNITLICEKLEEMLAILHEKK